MSKPFDLTGKFITDTYERLVQYSATGPSGPSFYDGLGNEIDGLRGETGPQGPQGVTGPQGPQGVTGPVNLSDTLDTVTARGATTSNQITVGGVTAEGPIFTSDNLYVSGKINTNSHRIAGWHIIEQNFIYVGAQEANPTGIVFDPTGTRMFYCGYSTNRIFQYNLSTPWDLLTAVDSGLSFYLAIGGVGGTIEDIYISPDGLNLYAVSRGNDTLGQYELASAWDLTSVTHIRTLAISSYDDNPTSVYFKDDGSVLYLLGYSSDDIYQISLSTPWDISTVGSSSSFSLNEFGISTPQGIDFNGDGTSLYIIGSSSDRITQFDLGVPWDITTATIGGYSPFYGYWVASSSSLFYDSASNNAFIIGRSSDRIYQLNTQIPTEFETPVIFDKSITVDNNIEVRELATFRGPSVFYNSSNFNSTFTTASTTRLIYGNGGTLDVGSTLYNTTNIRIGYNNFYPIDPSYTKSISLFRNFTGARGTIYIAETPTYTSTLINGIIDIDSNADTFDHEGELSVGRTLKVSGSQNLKYKEDNLHLEGNVSVLDTFTEASDTDISLHTPDIGNGYTQVYSDAPTAEFPIVSGGNGWMQPNNLEDNDGYIYRNNTPIGIADYEVRATIRRQPTDTDATFWLIARYQDNDNFYAMSFSTSTSYTFLYKRVAGIDTQLGVLNYWIDNRGNVDNINVDVALRIIGNEISIFYNGEYRGTAIDSSITDAGNAGFGFGAIFPSTFTGMDISNQWRISQYKVTELPSSLFSGDDSVHYIDKGNFGVGTTAPAYKLDVSGSGYFSDNVIAENSISAAKINLSGSGENEGFFSWNSTDATANLQLRNGVTLQLGQELHYHVINQSGDQINNGEVVYVSGVSSDKLSISPYRASLNVDPNLVIGIATSDIPNNGFGYVTRFGAVSDVNTAGFVVGTPLYAATGSSGYSDIAPGPPYHTVFLGFVLKEDTSEGIVELKLDHFLDADEIKTNLSGSNLSSTNVQAALLELDAKKVNVGSLSSNIILYPTTGPSPVSGYFRMVSSTTDPDYNTTAVDVSTGPITSLTGQLIASLASDEGLLLGSPGVINITTLGNIRKIGGNRDAYFYYELYRSNSLGETLIATSDNTPVVTSISYEEFFASALLNNGVWTSTDRVVIKYYGVKSESGGGDPVYEFQFGGDSPVRTLLPVPVSVIPSEDASEIQTNTSSFNNILSGSDSDVQKALDTLDDHSHTLQKITEEGNITSGRIIVGDITVNTSTIYSSGSKVGIGTTGPAYDLDVNGTARFTGGLTAEGGIESSNDITINDNSDLIIPATSDWSTGGEILLTKPSTFRTAVRIGRSSGGGGDDGEIELFRDGVSRFKFTGNGNNYINPTGLGSNLGIGTTTPTAKLHVSGSGGGSDVLLIEPAGAPTISLKSNSTLTDYSGLHVGSKYLLLTKDSGAIFQQIQGGLRFANGFAAKSVITENGYFGIGFNTTTGIDYPLDVKGDARISGSGIFTDDLTVTGSLTANGLVHTLATTEGTNGFQFQSNQIKPIINGYISLDRNSNRSFAFTDDAGSREYLRIDSLSTVDEANIAFNEGQMYISSSGNVGIGTTSPNQKLTVDGNIQLPNGGFIYGQNTGNYLKLDNATYVELGYSTTTAVRADGGAVTIRGTAGAERMRITPAGNVGIGTTSPSAKFHLYDNYTTAGGAYASPFYVQLIRSSTGGSPSATYFTKEDYSLSGTDFFGNSLGKQLYATISNTGNSIYRNLMSRVHTVSSGGANTIALYGTHFEGLGTGTIANFYSMVIGGKSGVSGFSNVNSTITNTYGLYLANLTSGTQTNDPYAIYQEGTEKIYLNGNVGIGITSPSAKLAIGNSSYNGNLAVAGSANNNRVALIGNLEIVNNSTGGTWSGQSIYIPGANRTFGFKGSGNLNTADSSAFEFNAIVNTNRTVDYTAFNLKGGYNTNTLAADYTFMKIDGGIWQNGINQSGSITGIDYNPTLNYITGSHTAMRLRSGDVVIEDGNVGIGTTGPSSSLHISGTPGSQFRIENPFTPTGTADTTGSVGDISWDDDYVYVKTSAGWKRSTLSTF